MKSYEIIDDKSLPKDLVWKPHAPMPSKRIAVWFSKPGAMYKRVRDTHTGKTIHYRRSDVDWSPINKTAIDTDEVKRPRREFRAGGIFWFIGFNMRWYTVRVTERVRNKITIVPVGKLDADKICEWPYPPELKFSACRNNAYFTRMRQLDARKP